MSTSTEHYLIQTKDMRSVEEKMISLTILNTLLTKC
nr:MAG TPA: hypothetical protein [Caudoviricetes sp.]DAQ94246.1 MAG TPA: hypothetical protein [Caudoviricetes sp.]